MFIDLNKPLPEGDAADFLESGITLEQFEAWATVRTTVYRRRNGGNAERGGRGRGAGQR